MNKSKKNKKNGSYTQCAAFSCGVLLKNEITDIELVKMLKMPIPPSMEGKNILTSDQMTYLLVFFNELPHEIIEMVLKENNIPISQIEKVFNLFPEVFQGKNFKEFLKKYNV